MTRPGINRPRAASLAALLSFGLLAGPPMAAEGGGVPRIVVLGDSLGTSAGRDSYPSVLQRRLEAGGYRYEVVNACRGGDTTAGGLARLESALEGDVSVLVLELGGNDGLRGVPLEQIRRNLEAIIARAKARGIRVLLAQMETAPSRGVAYARGFHNLFPDLAREHGLELIPFILADVYGRRELTTDGIHPNKQGSERIAATVWRSLEPVLEKPWAAAAR